VFSHTRILLHCDGVRIPKPKKNETEYLRLKTELNRTKIEKFKLTQPYLFRHIAWKRRGPILILPHHKYVIYLLTQTLTHLFTALNPHGAPIYSKAPLSILQISSHSENPSTKHLLPNFLHLLTAWPTQNKQTANDIVSALPCSDKKSWCGLLVWTCCFIPRWMRNCATGDENTDTHIYSIWQATGV